MATLIGSLLLNVDDHELGRYARSRLLIGAGFKTCEAGTGAEALALVAAARPAMVLLDVNLPDIDGFEVCRRIKSNPLSARTPVLQITASAVTPPQQAAGLDNGADGYLVEPIDPQVLLATVRSLLRLRRAEQDLERANTALEESNRMLTEVNAALQRSNDDLQRFSYMASHDLQEPLRTISTRVSYLERRYIGQLDGEAETTLRHIRAGTERMSALIRSLLAYAQIGSEKESLRDEVNLETVLAAALESLGHAVIDSNAEVTHDPLPGVAGNQTLLTQLFQNLLSNSLRYHHPDEPPRIHIAVEAADSGMWRFAFSDNGIGIEPQYHERIFEPFKRLHGLEVSGTGIGLASCRRIVERHGGSIQVESQGAGEGATFVFTLPASCV